MALLYSNYSASTILPVCFGQSANICLISTNDLRGLYSRKIMARHRNIRALDFEEGIKLLQNNL